MAKLLLIISAPRNLCLKLKFQENRIYQNIARLLGFQSLNTTLKRCTIYRILKFMTCVVRYQWLQFLFIIGDSCPYCYYNKVTWSRFDKKIILIMQFNAKISLKINNNNSWIINIYYTLARHILKNIPTWLAVVLSNYSHEPTQNFGKLMHKILNIKRLEKSWKT